VAFLEPDGELGVIKRSASDDDGAGRKASGA
jgi:hypothetical protein